MPRRCTAFAVGLCVILCASPHAASPPDGRLGGVNPLRTSGAGSISAPPAQSSVHEKTFRSSSNSRTAVSFPAQQQADLEEIAPPEPDSRVRVTYQDPGIRPLDTINLETSPRETRSESGQPLLNPPDFAQSLYTSKAVEAPFAILPAPGIPHFVADFGHRPLYFEEVNLERYGRSCGVLQPAVSTARFYCSLVALPYKVAIEPYRLPVFTSRHPYPAGVLAPRVPECPPLRLDAAVLESGAIIGLIALVP